MIRQVFRVELTHNKRHEVDADDVFFDVERSI